MSRVMRPKIRNLAFHPNVAILPLQMRARGRHQIAHRPGASLRRPETEPELIGRSHERSLAENEEPGTENREPRTENRSHFLIRPITYSTIESTTLNKIEEASGK